MNKLTGTVFCSFCGEDIPIEAPITRVVQDTMLSSITVVYGDTNTNGTMKNINVKHKCEEKTK